MNSENRQVSLNQEESDSQSSNQLEELVNKLYEFRDQYYCRAPLSDHGRKWEAVENEMHQTVIELKKHQDGYSTVPLFLIHYLLGRTRNVLPNFDAEAEEHLSLSVKHNPGFVEAWNELGECYWKAGNALSAKNCFSRALEKKKNKASLRNLSVVLRQLSAKDAEERKKFCFDGLQLAKEAVELDPKDSASWLILGNSYLSVTFYSNHNSGCLKKALAAYSQAEKYEHMQPDFNSADLYYNKAAALIFDEKYQEGLENLERSKTLDPSWELPEVKKRAALEMLRSLSSLVTSKGKLKARKLNTLIKGISTKDWGPYHQSTLKRLPIQDLKIGPNAGKFILGKVVASVPCEGGSPFACCVCDSDSTCIVVTIYRLAQGYGLTIGDSLLIPEPCLNSVNVTFHGETISYLCVRVDSPQTLYINGHLLRPNQMASMFMVSSTRHE